MGFDLEIQTVITPPFFIQIGQIKYQNALFFSALDDGDKIRSITKLKPEVQKIFENFLNFDLEYLNKTGSDQNQSNMTCCAPSQRCYICNMKEKN